MIKLQIDQIFYDPIEDRLLIYCMPKTKCGSLIGHYFMSDNKSVFLDIDDLLYYKPVYVGEL